MKHPHLECALAGTILLAALFARFYPAYTLWLVVGGVLGSLMVVSSLAFYLTWRKAPEWIFGFLQKLDSKQ